MSSRKAHGVTDNLQRFAQLFADLTAQRLFHGFARLHSTAGESPLAGEHAAIVAILHRR